MRSFQSPMQAKQSMTGQLGPIAVAITIMTLLLALLVALVGSPANAAGNNLVIEAVAIDLKPEYDSRDLLVAYSVQVKNTGTQEDSMQLTLPVPAGSRLKGVYEMTDNGSPAIEGAGIQGKGDTAAVSFSTPSIKPGQTTTVYAMYYWNGIKSRGNQRSVEFSFQSPINVPTAVFKVTEPEGSSDMKITPEPSFRMGEGTAISIIPIESLQAGKSVTVNLEYTSAGGRAKGNSNGSVLVVMGVLMLAGLGFLLWRGATASRSRKTPK